MRLLIILLVLLISTIFAQDISKNPIYSTIPNDSTGTALFKLAKIGSNGLVSTAGVTDTSNAVGIISGGAGNSGIATICILGNCPCIFDNTPHIRDYVTISTSIAGECHDAGSVFPTSGQLLGNVGSKNAPRGASAMVDMTLRQTAISPSGMSTNTVSCVTNPVFDLNPAHYSIQFILLNCNVASVSFTGMEAGSLVTFKICRDSSNRIFNVWPAAVHGAILNLTPLANTCDSQSFYSPDGINLWGNGVGVLNQ